MNTTKLYIEETASTNALIKDMYKNTKPAEGTVVYAGFQTAGRGQKETAWESEKSKNLVFSLILYPVFVKAGEQFIISQIVSLAIKNVLEKYVNGICIKWPNDIYYNDRKICGILVENELLDTQICASIIGIGLNINQEQFMSDAPNPVSLKQITGNDYNLEPLLDEIMKEVLSLYESAKTDKTGISDKYKQSLWRKNGYHHFRDADGEFSARIETVAENGLLTLQMPNGKEKCYAFKEVRFI
jgi:BirA family biotin operon repressor/biotin-[acetyl-CoA-carboxylase] ligase